MLEIPVQWQSTLVADRESTADPHLQSRSIITCKDYHYSYYIIICIKTGFSDKAFQKPNSTSWTLLDEASPVAKAFKSLTLNLLA